MRKPERCSNWTPAGLGCARSLPARTTSVWPNWIARSSAPAWTRCGSAPPNPSPKRSSTFLKRGEGEGEDEKTEIRDPKAERDPKPEGRNPNRQRQFSTHCSIRISGFVLPRGISDFYRRLLVACNGSFDGRYKFNRSRRNSAAAAAASGNATDVLGAKPALDCAAR